MAISDKITSITNHLIDDYKALENLGASVTDRNIENIKDMAEQIYDNYPKTSYGEGTEVTLENCNKGKLDFDKLEGDTEQYSTNGYQLLDIDNSEIGGIDASGNLVTNNNNWRATEYIPVSPNTSYTFSTIGYGTATYILRLYQYDENKTFISPRSEGNNNSTLTITTGATTKYLKWTLFLSNTAFTREIAEQCKLMLEPGSTAHTWEKYTGGIPAPNPTYPQTISSVTGNQEVVVRGKNLVEGLELGEINAQTGAEIPASNIVRTTNYIPYSRLKSYRQSVNGENLSSGTNLRFYNKNKEYIGYAIFGYSTSITDVEITKGSEVTTTDLEPKYFRIRVGTSVLQTDSKYMIANSNDLTYEPYITPITKTLALGDIELNAIGNYKDELIYDVDEDKVYKNEKIGKVVLNGSEDWLYSSGWSKTNTNVFYRSEVLANAVYADNSVVYGKCNYFTTMSRNALNSADTEGCSYSGQLNYPTITLRISKTIATDTDTLKTWLSTHNSIFYYEHKTPVETEITDTTLINQVKALYNAHSNNGTTIITSNGNLPIIVKVRSLKNG